MYELASSPLNLGSDRRRVLVISFESERLEGGKGGPNLFI